MNTGLWANECSTSGMGAVISLIVDLFAWVADAGIGADRHKCTVRTRLLLP